MLPSTPSLLFIFKGVVLDAQAHSQHNKCQNIPSSAPFNLSFVLPLRRAELFCLNTHTLNVSWSYNKTPNICSSLQDPEGDPSPFHLSSSCGSPARPRPRHTPRRQAICENKDQRRKAAANDQHLRTGELWPRPGQHGSQQDIVASSRRDPAHPKPNAGKHGAVVCQISNSSFVN